MRSGRFGLGHAVLSAVGLTAPSPSGHALDGGGTVIRLGCKLSALQAFAVSRLRPRLTL